MKSLSQRISDVEVRIAFNPGAKRAELDVFVKQLWEQRNRQTATRTEWWLTGQHPGETGNE